MQYPLFVDSNHTANYRVFRPGYPQQLYKHILEYYFNTTTPDKKIPLALDVACGSGQATVDLSNYCEKVIGIDGSENQLKQAQQKDNIEYQCHYAEDLSFLQSNSIDLITVATALHWFDIENFFKQVDRVLKPNGGVLSIWSHGLDKPANDKAANVKLDFINNDLNGCWNDRRKIVEEQYLSILDSFPYQATRVKHVIDYEIEMTIENYIKFTETMSPCQTYKEKNGEENFKKLLKTFADKLVECYTGTNNDGYKTKMIVKWSIHLHLMKKL
ncbi:unnamed protein product [Didymodactylos carnosus]|uniref:Methyltransferase type 11 domain-containing protein n=1 Tax=Didymodactylos carnosus TaxID=1234261 RepID=A0A813TII1_9BILA|nr:unnamed protein product [Didymodactylos carnosus]CAF0813211.1 unnamed protein product [Didymodactylos carnosus]CAF3572338.1 unnamed protein product [Didymodactylos carnosus]CAF3599069.1 unnamed protein product [Didymodactylos carnosus]